MTKWKTRLAPLALLLVAAAIAAPTASATTLRLQEVLSPS